MRVSILVAGYLLDTSVGVAAILVGGADAGGRITEMLGKALDDHRL